MGGHREHSRIKCESHCILMEPDGSFYEVLLEDISLGGALVEVKCDTRLRVGDLCDLMLSDNSAVFPMKRTGRIVRFDSKRNVGVCFLHQ